MELIKWKLCKRNSTKWSFFSIFFSAVFKFICICFQKQAKAKDVAPMVIKQLERDQLIVYFSLIQLLVSKFFSTIPIHFDKWFFRPLMNYGKVNMEGNLFWVQENQPHAKEQSRPAQKISISKKKEN